MSVSRSAFAAWCAITIFVSAFLLFQVQPLISKMILPWFGGGPGVWTTCLLFFQVALLLGYGYAHRVAMSRRPLAPVIVHCVLLSAALLSLPIMPSSAWKPTDSTQPTFHILALLAAKVGLPYFLLASTGPLVQAWFARQLPGTSPYRLYALSNIGSLLALLSYPFVFEPLLNVSLQGWLWSGCFALFALLSGGLAVSTWKSTRPEWRRIGTPPPAAEISDEQDPPGVLVRLTWVLLPALGSLMLLAVTHHVCQDVAVIPFLWVAPLALYLLSFIITFDNERWYLRKTCALIVALMVAFLSVVALDESITETLNKASDKTAWMPGSAWTVDKLQEGVEWAAASFEDITMEAGFYLTLLFFICMLCHGELVKRKPVPRWLTSFYFMISAGGALGGITVALICPQLFSFNVELYVGLVASYMLAVIAFAEGTAGSWLGSGRVLRWSGWGLAFAGMLLIVRAQFQAVPTDAMARARNFYGVLRVSEVGSADSPSRYRALYNGRIMHGLQMMEESQRNVPTSYYAFDSGVGVAMRRYRGEEPRRVAVVGLGTGSMAVYLEEGQFLRFYEINPKVIEFAHQYFTYLKDCPATVEIELGDARLSMEREEPQQYDIIVLDAFSGDAIPVHLLTREAFEIYFRHLKPEGILAVHISNRHLELTPVVAGLAEHFSREVIKIEIDDFGEVSDAASDWMLVTSNQEFLEDSVVRSSTSDFSADNRPISLWTDQYSNLFQILK